jgi:hypothetical protein
MKEKEGERVKKPGKGLRPYDKRPARENRENVHNVFIFLGQVLNMSRFDWKKILGKFLRKSYTW